MKPSTLYILVVALLLSSCSTTKSQKNPGNTNDELKSVGNQNKEQQALDNQNKDSQAEDKNQYAGYLFTYFTGNNKADESIRFAVSRDGYTYKALNNNKPVILSEKISETGGVRDPHILRGADGKTFYMVVTDMVSSKGWNSNRGMVLMKSNDLINWTSTAINFQKRFKGQDSLLRVWAPQTIYDPVAKKYMVYFSLKYGDGPDKIYYLYTNDDFTDFVSEPKQLFFSPTNGASIDGDIIYKDGKYHLFFKTEGSGAGIKVAVSDKLTEGYQLIDQYVQQTKDPVEGAGVFKLNNSDEYILMYDVYTKGKYQFTKTKDLENFTVIDEAVSMDFHPRHGTVMPITEEELQRLEKKWKSDEPMAIDPSWNNPVLKGLYADPDIIYSEKLENIISIQPVMDLRAGPELFSKHSLQRILLTGRMKE